MPSDCTLCQGLGSSKDGAFSHSACKKAGKRPDPPGECKNRVWLANGKMREPPRPVKSVELVR